ncbi:O-methyltransferase family 2 [Leptolyngbya sp. NIES-3755]|nr:O-methyltransferase family 2 [Leptolyngbya sp. NIES-3755]
MQTTHSPVTPDRLMQFVFGYAPPLMIEAAIEHRVFDVLDEGAKTVEQLSQATGASIRGLRILLDALVALEFLARDAEQQYKLTPESAAFLVSTKPSFQGGLFRHTSHQLLPKWLELTEIVRTGKPAMAVNHEAVGTEFFQQFVNDIFPLSYPAAQVLAEVLQVAQTQSSMRVLDLAAGAGVWGITIAQASPQVYVSAIDWAGVIPVTQGNIDRLGLSDRVKCIAGDLLTTDFGTAYDLAILGHILHSEGEIRSRQLLKKVFEALAPGGTIAIAEWLMNDDRTGPANAAIFAVNMLVNSEEGDTYSFGEINSWLTQIGFINARTIEAPGPSPLILAMKPH